ncbi:hypothetical protein LBO01_14190 [Companilactobacillus paralimentarius]|nr:hypothetical protein ATN92_00980 [Companilactobacillus bobalius]GEO58290.1 hypothetical protein LBO01_14190 [Companilactobacillus paralimentarius]
MKKWVISLLSVGMLLGIFGMSGISDSDSPNTVEETVQADTSSNNERTINYVVYRGNSSLLSPMDAFFTKSADITSNDDGSYKVTLTAEVSNLTSLKVTTIDNQQPSVSSTYTKNAKKYLDISFNIKSLSELDKPISGTVQTKLLDLNVDKATVNFKFDSSSLDGQKSNTFLNSLKSITDAEDETKSVLADAKDTANSIKNDLSTDNDNDIITAPKTTNSQTASTTNNNQTDNDKTVIKELTYKVAKDDGDGAMISPYFTNTAKVMQNPDGTYYVEMTIKYPKKFGNNAIQLNYINNEKPTNLSFTSSGDSNYLKFDFPINNLSDLGKVIPGNATLNLPDFNLDKDLNFDLNFDGFNPSDISGIVSSSDVSGLLSDLSSLSNSKNIKTDKTTNDNKALGTLPQTGEETNAALGIIGGLLLILWIVLLKTTYLKK